MHRPQPTERHRRAGAGAGPLAEADALLSSPTLTLSQAARALSLYQGALATGGAPGALLANLGRTCFVLGKWPPSRKAWSTTARGSLTPRP